MTRVTFKKFNYSERRSEETLCIVGDLYLDGMLIGPFENEGKGGGTWVRPNGEAARKRLREWDEELKACEPLQCEGMSLPWDSELYIDQLATLYIDRNQLKRLCRTKLVFELLTPQGKVVRHQASRKGSPPENLRAWAKEKHGANLVRILNDLPDVEPKLVLKPITPGLTEAEAAASSAHE